MKSTAQLRSETSSCAAVVSLPITGCQPLSESAVSTAARSAPRSVIIARRSIGPTCTATAPSSVITRRPTPSGPSASCATRHRYASRLSAASTSGPSTPG